MRSSSDAEAFERLRRAAEQFGLVLGNWGNVVALSGDISDEYLGLSYKSYMDLSLKIDAVINCAAKVNHVDVYCDGSSHDIRTHNVVGLNNILRFAGNLRTKPVFHAGSLIFFNDVTDTGLVKEEFPPEEEMGQGIENGYFLSKLIGEKLLLQARSRGIPVTVIRFPFLLGTSQIGNNQLGFNHFWAMIQASIRVRLIPRGHLNGAPVVALDAAAKLAMNIFFNDNAEDGVYNLTVDFPLTDTQMLNLMSSYGISAEAVSFEEWRDAIFDESEGSAIDMLASLYTDQQPGSKNYNMATICKNEGDLYPHTFSPKVKTICPEVSKLIPASETVVRRCLEAQFHGGN